jgi:agmatinase
LKPFPIKKNIADALKQIENINKLLIDKKKFPLVLGGEHSLTSGAIRPFVKKFDKLCLLHFDAHADLRNSYNGNKFSHASAIRRCLDYPKVSVVSFG